MADLQIRMARPERFRISLRDDTGVTRIPLPSRRMWPVGIILGVMFLIFAGIAWGQIASMRGHAVRGVFDLFFLLFQGFWVLGWSVGVVLLGGLTVLFFVYGESAGLRPGSLIHTPRLGPLRINLEYNIAEIRNLRMERAGKNGGDLVQIRFDYGGGGTGLGDAMPRTDAERLVARIREAAPRASDGEARKSAPPPVTRPAESPSHPRKIEPPSLTSPSALALIGANLIPLAGIQFFEWDLSEVMVLFWAESAVIGFWNVIKLAVVGKWEALLAAPFFTGHFGGFMAIHFLFIYYFFVRGLINPGPEPSAEAALLELFLPLWPALAALFLSHGVSFFTNYVGQREYLGVDLKTQMAEPYKRIIVMHLTIIIGGFLTMLFGAPEPALALLIILKTIADLIAHRKEHAR